MNRLPHKMLVARNGIRRAMTPPALALLVLFLGLTVSGCISRPSVEARDALLAPDYQIVRPEGDGPFPVVLLFHGCGGLVGADGEKTIMRDYAEVAAREGYIALIVDSFRPRGISFDEGRFLVCIGVELRGRHRAGDVVAALSHARGLPEASGDGHVLAGWSHGGWAVMETMIMDMRTDWPRRLARPDPQILAPVSGVYLTYPYCGFPSRAPRRGWARPVRASVLIAGEDVVSRPARCDAAFARMRDSGVELDVEVFDGVTHAFDEADQTPESAFVYDAAAAARAHARFAAFLRDLREDAAPGG